MAPLLPIHATPSEGAFSALPAREGYPCDPSRKMRSRDFSSAMRSRACGKCGDILCPVCQRPISLFPTSDNQAVTA